MQIEKNYSFSDAFAIYMDYRMLKILLIGSISGFPWVLIGSSLSLWLKEDGLSRSTIGWAGLIFAVYAFNYLWAPLIDRVRIPFLTRKIGHRRGWIVLMQMFIIFSLIAWSFISPIENLFSVISIGLIIAIASATQDITLDALRIEQINENEGKVMQAGAAISVVGWWTGYKLGGVLSLAIADYLQTLGFNNYWQITFLVLCLVIVIFNILLLFINEKKSSERLERHKHNDLIFEKKFGKQSVFKKPIIWITSTVISPIISFLRKMVLKSHWLF